ncbi:MAG: phospholipase D-like domain-containing protein, partial [Rhodanobacteraceae bacterium]
MGTLGRGLYEQLLTDALEADLQRLDPTLQALRGALDAEEAPDRIALHIGALLRRSIARLGAADRRSVGIRVAREIVELLKSTNDAVDPGDMPTATGEVLRAILGFRPDGSAEGIEVPATPLLDTTLLTNAPGEPHIGYQVKSEIASADRIDILMAFVRRTGIAPMLEAIRRRVEAGCIVRLLTTTYTGSTELAALRDLAASGVDIRISYDTTSTRLHAKAWLFHRKSGYSTAYIGSSNLTHSAQVTGLEWNVRVAGARNPDVLDKFSAVFESYWQSGDFRPFDEPEFRELTQAALS